MATMFRDAYPLQAIGYPGYVFYPATFDGLTEVGLDGQPTPALALSWRAEGESAWVFELRPGVKFANGEPFDAAAAAATIDHVLSTEGRRTSSYREVASIARAEVRGPLTLALVTRMPDPMLPRKLVSIKMLPPKYIADVGLAGFNRQPYGTGPFVEATRTPARIDMARNPHAWRPAALDRFSIVKLEVSTTRFQALAAGEADIALDMSPDMIADIEALGGRAISMPSGSVDAIQFITSKPSPLRDVRVRRALNYAVDKQRIVDQLLRGATRVATQFAPQGAFGFDDTLHEPFPYDPDKARALLAEAGFPNGFDLPIEMMNSIPAAPFEQVAADLRAVGVRVAMTSITVPAYTDNYYRNTWKGLAFSSGYTAAPSLDPLSALRLHSCLWQAPWYCDPDIAERITATDRVFNENRRRDMTRDLLARLNADPPAILMNDGFKITGLGPKVGRFEAPGGFIRFDLLTEN